MDGRREPRFQIYASAKMTLVDKPEHEVDCLLLEISATGLKFVADESLLVDEIVALEVEDHLVLADVRYSQARGEKYAIGAERIHAVQKSALPDDKTKSEQIRFVVEDYRNRIRAAITNGQPAAKTEEPGGQYRDQIVETAVQKLLEQWAKESESSTPDGTMRAAIVERVAQRAAQHLPEPAPKPAQAVAHPARSRSRLPIATAGAIAMVVFTGSIFWSYRHSVAANVSRPAAIPGKPVQPAAPEPLAAPASTQGMRHAEIRVTEPVWVYAVSDGKEVLQKLLAKDETKQIEFADKVLVRVGNAGGVEITVDGKSIGPLGPSGKIRAIEITSAGHRFVPLSEADPDRN